MARVNVAVTGQALAHLVQSSVVRRGIASRDEHRGRANDGLKKSDLHGVVVLSEWTVLDLVVQSASGISRSVEDRGCFGARLRRRSLESTGLCLIRDWWHLANNSRVRVLRSECVSNKAVGIEATNLMQFSVAVLKSVLF